MFPQYIKPWNAFQLLYYKKIIKLITNNKIIIHLLMLIQLSILFCTIKMINNYNKYHFTNDFNL